MTHPDLMTALANERLGTLRAEAAAHRLARIAACCRPSVLAATIAALRVRLAARTRPVGCCA